MGLRIEIANKDAERGFNKKKKSHYFLFFIERKGKVAKKSFLMNFDGIHFKRIDTKISDLKNLRLKI